MPPGGPETRVVSSKSLVDMGTVNHHDRGINDTIDTYCVHYQLYLSLLLLLLLVLLLLLLLLLVLLLLVLLLLVLLLLLSL